MNDEGIPIILDLVDQVYGLRRMLRELLAAMQARLDDGSPATQHADLSPYEAVEGDPAGIRIRNPDRNRAR